MTERGRGFKLSAVNNTINRNEAKRKEEAAKAYDDIISVFCSVTSKTDMVDLFDDIFTPSERDDMVKRWLLMDDLYKGKPQREIAADRNLSLCKITRGSKMLKKEDGFMRRFLSRRYDDDQSHL